MASATVLPGSWLAAAVLGMSQPEKGLLRVSDGNHRRFFWAASDTQQELFPEAWVLPSSSLCFGSAA